MHRTMGSRKRLVNRSHMAERFIASPILGKNKFFTVRVYNYLIRSTMTFSCFIYNFHKSSNKIKNRGFHFIVEDANRTSFFIFIRRDIFFLLFIEFASCGENV